MTTNKIINNKLISMTTFWTDLHKAICTTLKKEVPTIQTCEDYPVVPRAITTPAVLVALTSFEPGTGSGTEELALRARFEARIIVDSTHADTAMTVRMLATEVARVVHQNSFGVNVAPAKFLGAKPAESKPGLGAYLVWSVQWVHEIHCGSSIWTQTGTLPSIVYSGCEPEVGVMNKSKYTKVHDG